ncbi:hypothetical protein BH10BDE1_BH10BDE1_28750 [soil metagenome]
MQANVHCLKIWQAKGVDRTKKPCHRIVVPRAQKHTEDRSIVKSKEVRILIGSASDHKTLKMICELINRIARDDEDAPSFC